MREKSRVRRGAPVDGGGGADVVGARAVLLAMKAGGAQPRGWMSPLTAVMVSGALYHPSSTPPKTVVQYQP
jgi:hypothetical protein